MAYKKEAPVETDDSPFNHNFDLEEWDIKDLFKDTIWLEFIDESAGNKTSRGGIHIPETARSLKDFYRIGRVLKVGPEVSDSVQEGSYLLVPPNLGMVGLKKGPNGGSSLFIREELIMAVIGPKTDEAVRVKEEEY